VPEARRAEAERLATQATEASILGDNRSALDLLTSAAARDPSSDRIAYRLARTYEELDNDAEAIREYCRYLALAPDAPDAREVRDRLAALTDPGGLAVPVAAVQAFESALVHYDAGRPIDAEAAFNIALTAAPTWGDALYNRGVVRLALGRRGEATEDLRRYLEQNPGSGDFSAVLDAIGAPREAAAARYNPGTAFATGLIVPGLGHFTTGRPGRGLLYFGAAAGAAAAGVMWQRVEVECLSPPENGSCPAGQVLRERTERPYLLPAIGAAAAIGVIGALDAARGARRRNAEATELLRAGGPAGGGAALLLPSFEVRPDGAHFNLIRIHF
jgi:tetratricopeptide (TPR) repeat protein